ncbi:MAG: lipopolysaccharide kinase InaA family protein [Candidatus Brocadiia bacterium]|jgi:hypothetical protein|nr:lipopolysaccharide kinase InaA family protein [Candidatus Brocadiia bacterium]
MGDSGQDQVVEVQAHGLRWLATADFADALPALDVDRTRRPEELGRDELVKSSTVRTVARLAHPAPSGDECVYVKYYKPKSAARRLLYLVRPTQAAQEWRMARALRQAGIQTCRVLATVQSRCGPLHQGSFLVSEEIPGTIRLWQYLDSEEWYAGDAEHKRGLIEELAALIAALVRARFLHGDFHTGNLLINPSLPVGQRLFVLDLHRIRRATVRRKGLVNMLVFLADSTRAHNVTAMDRLRLLRAVLMECRWPGENSCSGAAIRGWVRSIERGWQRRHSRRMRSRTRRCLLFSSQFTHGRYGDYRIWRRREFTPEHAMEAVSLHEEALKGDQDAGEVRKADRRSAITICRLRDRQAVCVKAYRHTGLAERFKDFMRPGGRAKAAWVAHRGLAVRGIPTADALALLEARGPFQRGADYLITEALPAVGGLGELSGRRRPATHDRLLPLPPAEERVLIGAAVAALFRSLAEQMVRHPDLKPGNIMLGRPGGEVRLWLVDLDRVRFDHVWQERDWVRHLAQCDAGLARQVSALVRMRCLRVCGRGAWSWRDRLRIARAVRAASLLRRPERLESGAAAKP